MADQGCETCPSVEIVKGQNAGIHSQLAQASSKTLQLALTDPAPLQLIFAQTNAITKCSSCRQNFSEAVRVPELWWYKWCQRSRGYFGCEATFGGDNEVDGYNTWLRYIVRRTFEGAPNNGKSFSWQWLNVITRWLPSTGGTTIVVFDPQSDVRESLLHILESSTAEVGFHGPYFCQTIIAEALVTLEDRAVVNVRDMVRMVELEQAMSAPDFSRLHDIARDVIQVTETLGHAIQIMDNTITQCDRYSAIAQEDRLKRSTCYVQDRLRFYQSILQGQHLLCVSISDRLRNEIQLSFNTVAQRDSRSANEISKAVKIDSTAMKAIAALTAIFLPPTYVATVFSTSFFDFDLQSGEWAVSRQFWIYWVTSVPLTSLGALIWYQWQSRLTYDYSS